jgi:hypothetical protein
MLPLVNSGLFDKLHKFFQENIKKIKLMEVKTICEDIMSDTGSQISRRGFCGPVLYQEKWLCCFKVCIR